MFDQNMGALSDVHYRTMCRQCGAEVEHSLKQPSTVSCPNGHVVGPSLQLGQVLSGEDLPALDGQKITRDIVSAFKKAGYPPLVTGDVGTSKWWFDRGYSIKAHEQPVRCKGGHLRLYHRSQVVDRATYDLDDKLKSLIENLAELGQRDAANRCADRVRKTLPGMLGLYKKLAVQN
jgi:hypothetical protein